MSKARCALKGHRAEKENLSWLRNDAQAAAVAVLPVWARGCVHHFAQARRHEYASPGPSSETGGDVAINRRPSFSRRSSR